VRLWHQCWHHYEYNKTNSSAINLSTIADASNPTGGFVINGEATDQIIQAIAVDIACTGD
jgi:hypothetical protein